MAIGLEDKKAIVAEVNEAAGGALSAVLGDYRGVTASDMTSLRKLARENSVYLRVVRNTLARRAVEGTEFECIKDVLVGPTILAFSMEDPGCAARLVKTFSKDHANLETKFVSVSGQLLEASELERLSKLPTKDQAISMLMALMLAPTEKLVRTLNEVPTKLTRFVAAVRDQKQ